VARRIETAGVTKARLPLLPMVMLGVLAGGFIALGALYFVLVTSDASLGFALGRVLGGIAFSAGLVMCIVAGAELFTGNNLLAMAWADRRITTAELLYNWLVVALSNLAGALGVASIVYLSGHADMNGGAVAAQYVKVAAAKCDLSFAEAFFRGILCNFLVCIAVWMAMAGRSVADKILAIVFPISAFVAAGFEHSVANMYIIPLAILLQGSSAALPSLTWAGFVQNLVPVILGNLVGGSVLVALVYHVVYRRGLAPEGGAPVRIRARSQTQRVPPEV
jgi:formate/nitrite transporter